MKRGRKWLQGPDADPAPIAQGGESRSHYQLGMHTAFSVSQADE